MANQENLMLKNAFILSFAAIVSKVLGAFYQAFLYRAVGPEGVALYMRGINVYTILLAISAAGIPIAISKLMAEEIAKGQPGVAYRLFKVALWLLSGIGLILSLALFFAAPFLAQVVFDSPVTWVMQALAPAIFIVTVMGAIRGFFQGQQNMVPTAYSQIVEQVGRIAFSVGIAVFFIMTVSPTPVAEIVNGIALGPFIGALLGFLLLFFFYHKNKNKLDRKINFDSRRMHHEVSTGRLVSRILLFAVPVTVAALLPTLVDFSDAVLIPRVLKSIGFSIQEADRYFGFFSGAALTLINIVTLVASSFAASLVPAISDAKGRGADGEVQSKTVLSTKLVLLIALPAAFGMGFLGRPILELIFGAGAGDATQVLQFGVLMIIFMSIYHSTTGVLQGIGRIYIPLISLAIGLAINIICLYTFISQPGLNILGAPLAHTIAFFVAAIINYLACKKSIQFKMGWKQWFFQAFLASLVTILIAFGLYTAFNFVLGFVIQGFVNHLISLGVGVIASLGAYPFFLVLFKAVEESEVSSIPKVGFIFKRLFVKLRRR